MKNRILLLSGLLASLIYIAAVWLGGRRRPGYSHTAQAVSELIENGATDRPFLNPFFGLYNILTGLFGVALLRLVRCDLGGDKRSARIGSFALLGESLAGLLTLFYPQDPRGAPASRTGNMHLILAGLSSLLTMIAMLCLGLSFRKRERPAGEYTLASFALVLATGPLAAVSAARGSKWMGLYERITIGGFIQWLAFISAYLARITDR